MAFEAMAGDGADPGDDLGPGLGLPFEAFLNPVELGLAHRVVDGLAPDDPLEEIHTWHLAAAHLLAAQRIGKSRQEGLSQRAEQIEIGLAVRIMTLADRKAGALDRHRALKHKMARDEKREAERAAGKAVQKTAREEAPTAAPEDDFEGGVRLVPERLSPEAWTRMVRDMERHRESGAPGPSAPYRIWQEGAERALAEARARGEQPGVFTAPWPSEAEAAAQLTLERAATGGAGNGTGDLPSPAEAGFATAGEPAETAEATAEPSEPSAERTEATGAPPEEPPAAEASARGGSRRD